MDEPIEVDTPQRRDSSAIGTVGLAIIVFILGVVVGIPLALFGAEVLLVYAGQVFALLFGVFLVALAVAALIGLFRKRIWGMLFRKAEVEMHRFARPLADVASFAASQKVQEATDAARDLAELVLARYAWISTRRWMVATLTGLIAAIAALAGSALLFQQNQLLRTQSELMAQQTDRLNEQTRMLETQIQLGEAQRSSSIVPEILAIGAAIGEATSNMPLIATEAGTTMLKPELRARIVAATLAVRPYRYLVYGLDTINESQLIGQAVARRTDLALTQKEYAETVAAMDKTWGLAAADPRAETGELTDRIVSPERGHLLGTMHHSGLKDLTQLTYEGADFSFAEVRTPRLQGINLQYARLDFADFSGVALQGARFQAAQLDYGRFVRSAIADAVFASVPNGSVVAPFEPDPVLGYRPTRLVGADFSLAGIVRTDFSGIQAVGVNFDGAVIGQSGFAHAFLTAATFRNAVLYEVDFTGADLSKVDFDGAAVFDAAFLDGLAASAGAAPDLAYTLEPMSPEQLLAHPNQLALTQLPEAAMQMQTYRLRRTQPIEPAVETTK